MKQFNVRALMTKSIILLFILIIPFNIMGLCISALSYHYAINNIDNMISYTMDSYLSLLNNRLSNTDSMFYDVLHINSDFITMAKQENNWKYDFSRYQVFDKVYDQLISSSGPDGIFFYMDKKEDLLLVPYYTGRTNEIPPEIITEFIYDYSTDYAHWFLIFNSDHPVLLRILNSPDLDVYYGAYIDLSNLLEDLYRAIDFDTITFTFSDTAISGASDTVVWSVSLKNSLFLNASVSKKEFGSSIGFWQYSILIFFILYLFLTPVLIFLLKRYVGHPLGILNYAHSQLKEGNQDYRIFEEANSIDFQDAFISFNDMAFNLQRLQQEVINKELANKQLQLEYLQLQIHPHFLLNTFNVLYTLIQNHQKKPAQDLVLYLSDYFRYLFRSGNELQLFAKELQLIEDYLAVCKIYYPDAFTVSYQIDPVLNLMRIPPLLLHSFLENIMQHALVPNRIVHIVFHGEYDEGYVTFYISDDGKGMDKKELDIINSIENAPIKDGKNVGIKNSIQRLKYYFGSEANVSVESELNMGTTFIIIIPYDLEET